jgi:hypothetical protein
MDEKVVKIPLSVFHNRYNIEVPPNIIQKADALKKSCSCFDSFYDPKMIWEKKLYYKKERGSNNTTNHSSYASHAPYNSHASYASHAPYNSHASHAPYNSHASHSHQHHSSQASQASQHHSSQASQHHSSYASQHHSSQASQASHYPNAYTSSNKGRVHIIIPDFSDNSNTKRSLIGQLNKLTIKNKDVICEKIKNIIADNNTEEIFLIILSYIRVYDGDNNLYIGLLEYFDSAFLKDMIDKRWNSYLQDKEWVPPKYIFENNLLLLNN